LAQFQGAILNVGRSLTGRSDSKIDMDVPEITADPVTFSKNIHTQEKNLPGHR
jgi:hypothetical protein